MFYIGKTAYSIAPKTEPVSGDFFMSLIYTAELCEANAFDYLTQLQRHPEEVARAPARWLPWNYRDTLLESSKAA